MASRFCKSILTTGIWLIIIFVASGQPPKANNESGNKRKSEFDTSGTAIIPFVPDYPYLFDSSYKSATLTQDDLDNIDSLLIVCVKNFNNSLANDRKHWGIDLIKHKYRRQLIAVINKKGEKEVWINCLCDTWSSNKWKTEIILVADGGNCYFNFKINLATKEYYDLGVNGEA